MGKNHMKKFKKSFYDWCIENNRQDLLDRWDYELNEFNPKDIASGSNIRIYFKCKDNNNHKSIIKTPHKITRIGDKGIIKCPECRSFYQWCVSNNRSDILDIWNYELNSVSPADVSYCSNGKYYFNCPNNVKHESKLMIISNWVYNNNSSFSCIECNSFEKWAIEKNCVELLDRWDYNLNKVAPNTVLKHSHKSYYFKCPNGLHNSIKHSLTNIVSTVKDYGVFNSKCIQCNSFAQWGIDNFGKDFLEKYWDYEKNSDDPYKVMAVTGKKYWIKCPDNSLHPSYLTMISNFNRGNRCPYCSNHKIIEANSLGFLHPDSISLWSNKNNKSPYKYAPYCNDKVFWKCENEKHDDYLRRINNSVYLEYRCPKCAVERKSSILQEKVANYINDKYNFTLKHEYDCNIVVRSKKRGHKMPFDNEVVEIKLIIEVHGSQHYGISIWNKIAAKSNNTTPEIELQYLQERDLYKKNYAISKGYHYLEIPYWAEKDESYKQLIDGKINEIMQSDKYNAS